MIRIKSSLLLCCALLIGVGSILWWQASQGEPPVGHVAEAPRMAQVTEDAGSGWKPALPRDGVDEMRARVLRADSDSILLEYSLPGISVVPLGADAAGSDRSEVAVSLRNAPLPREDGHPALPEVPVKAIIPFGRTLEKVEILYGEEEAFENVVVGGVGGRRDAGIYASDRAYPRSTYRVIDIQRRNDVSVAHLSVSPFSYKPKSGKLTSYRAFRVSLKTVPSPQLVRQGRVGPVLPVIDDVINPEALSSYPTRSGTVQISRVDRGYLVDFEVPDIKTTALMAAGKPFVNLDIPGYGTSSDVGRPDLPTISFNVLVADGENTPRVKVLQQSAEKRTLATKVLPVQQPWPKSKPIADRPFAMDKAFYASSGEKAPLVGVSAPFVIRGSWGVTVTIRPVSYRPDEDLLKIVREARFRIDLDKKPLVDDVHPKSFVKLLRGTLVNFDSAHPVPRGGPKADRKYLIITAPAFESGLTDFVTFRNARGFDVEVITTAVTGTTTSEIKSFLQGRYDNVATRPEFVLLVGDTDTVPAWNGTESGSPKTDLYYTTLDGTDYFPDVFIGRFAVADSTQLNNIITKTIYMEDNLHSLTKQNVFMASVDNYSISEGTHNHVIDNHFAPDGYTCTKRYSHTYNATTSQVTSDLNAGQIFAIYSGHGGTTSWADGPSFSQGNVNALTNTVYPFVYSFACLTGSYGESECFGETWIRGAQGGASFWGASSYSYWDEDDVLEKEIFKAMFVDGVTENTPMFNQGLIAVYNHYSGGGRSKYYFEIYDLLGDPALETYESWFPNPEINYLSHTADDSGGNDDGIVNPDEDVSLSVTLKNMGLGGVTGVNATLSTSDGFITLTDASASFGSISGAGGEATASDPFAFYVSDTCPTPREVTFTLNITDDAGGSWMDTFTQTVYTSCEISGSVVTATGANPISGATVSFSGPLSGSVTTGSGGEYSVTVVDGTYSLVARASGYLDSSPVQAIVPPDAANVDFALGMADIDVLPSPLVATAEEGASVTVPLAISNTGDATLTWELLPSTYRADDSDSVGGPVYSWIEISGSGTQITGLGDDTNVGPFNIGFDFPFYGQSFSTFRVCSNGWLSFTSNYTTYGNTGLPNSSSPPNLVAFFWDDLSFSSGGSAWYQQIDAHTLVLQFQEVPYFGSSTEKVTCQVILKDDGEIRCQYKRVDIGDQCTVGIQNGTCDTGLEVAYNACCLHNDMAIRIRKGYGAMWLDVSPTSGSVSASDSQVLNATMDAANLDEGTHSATLGISSNDTDETLVEVPVTFTVTAAPRMVCDGVTLDDDASAPSDGDGDGVAEPGETVELTLGIRNTGHATGSGLTGTLSESDPHVSILASGTTFPNASAGAVVSSQTACVVQIAPTCPNNHSASFTLTVSDGSGRNWTCHFTVLVSYRSVLSGVVTDLGSGAPIAGASVSVAGQSSTSAADGSYVVNGIPAGTHSVSVVRSGYVSVSQSVTVPPDTVMDFQLGCPDISLSPGAFTQTLTMGDTDTQSLEIANNGSLPLTWSISASTGGYSVSDSDSVGGPTYGWNEISGTGTRISGLGDDTNLGPYAIGFSFPFYGQDFDTFRVCSNGWLSFTSTSTAFTNAGLPNGSAPGNMLAVCWDDLTFTTNSSAWYQLVDADTLVVQYQDVSYYNDPSKWLTCQVILKSNGTILYQYKRIDIADACTVGLQNADGSEGVQLAYDESYLRAGLAVRLAPEAVWLGISPDAGTTAAGGTSEATLAFDATGLAAGTYETNIVVVSDDPETPNAVVPVTLNVEEPNEPPVATSFSATTSEDVPVGTALQVTDADGDALTYTILIPPAHGSFVGQAPNLSYVPDRDYHGSDSFTYKANDGRDDSNTATVSITVTPVNDPPVANGQSVETDEDVAVVITLSATDVDGDSCFCAIETGPRSGTLLGAPPNVTYKPDLDFVGDDSFTFRASDGQASSNLATVRVKVRSANDPPVIVSQPTATPNPAQVGQRVDFSVGATDPEGDARHYSWNFGDGNWANGPAPHHAFNSPGDYTVVVTVSDGQDSSQASVVVSVRAGAGASGLSGLETIKVLAKSCFKRSGRDVFMVKGTLPNLAQEFDVSGKPVEINVAGAVVTCSLDHRGRGTGTACKVVLKNRRGTWWIIAKGKRGDWAGTWIGAGMVNDTVKSVSLTLPIALTIDGTTFGEDSSVLYSGKKDSRGIARSVKK